VQYIVVTAVAAIVTFLVVPIVRKVAFRTNQVVQPGGRMAHLKPTPTLGGIGMLVGFGAAMGAGRLLHAFRPVFTDSSEPTGVLLAAIAITAIGVIDDVWNLSAPAKVAGQVLSASLLWVFGVTMFWF
jgi:UDP-GlcNAc:undecaprenyl-phosphate GlcNAc-1-phosphate transferase